MKEKKRIVIPIDFKGLDKDALMREAQSLGLKLSPYLRMLIMLGRDVQKTKVKSSRKAA